MVMTTTAKTNGVTERRASTNGLTERRSSTTQVAEVHHLKQRVQELEKEVQGYKKRLDDLRKAKNQTILKREREILEVSSPFQRRASESNITKDDKNMIEKGEIDKLKAAHAQELKSLQSRIAALEVKEPELSDCGHAEQIEQLTSALEAVENEKEAHRIETVQLKEKLKQTLHELSLKEASWCQREEELKRSLSTTFGERYQQWMRETEAKIVELQAANAQLRLMLEAHRPSGPDPTGQDRRC